MKSSKFFYDIEKFNEMYKLPQPTLPTMAHQRLEDFQSIIEEEVEEGRLIVSKQVGLSVRSDITPKAGDVDILTDTADWLGDMVIYCTSEMRRYGLDPATVLDIIMQSNFSKLGEDGQPIYDQRGKVMKGPNYWKPEPKLKEYIESVMKNSEI